MQFTCLAYLFDFVAVSSLCVLLREINDSHHRFYLNARVISWPKVEKKYFYWYYPELRSKAVRRYCSCMTLLIQLSVIKIYLTTYFIPCLTCYFYVLKRELELLPLI